MARDWRVFLVFHQFEVLREKLSFHNSSKNLMDFGTSVIEFPFMKAASDPSAKTFASVIRYSMPESGSHCSKKCQLKMEVSKQYDEFIKGRSL